MSREWGKGKINEGERKGREEEEGRGIAFRL